jgi:hypothetical protein
MVVNIVQAKGDIIFISKTESKIILFILHSKKIEDKLPKDLFLKVHRSLYYQYTKKIIDIEDNSVLIAKM